MNFLIKKKQGKINTALNILLNLCGCLIRRQTHSKPRDLNNFGALLTFPVKKSSAPPTAKIILTLFTLLFFLSAFSVKAENVSDGSALLINKSLIGKESAEELRQIKIKVAIENVLRKYDSPMAAHSESFVKAVSYTHLTLPTNREV